MFTSFLFEFPNTQQTFKALPPLFKFCFIFTPNWPVSERTLDVSPLSDYWKYGDKNGSHPSVSWILLLFHAVFLLKMVTHWKPNQKSSSVCVLGSFPYMRTSSKTRAPSSIPYTMAVGNLVVHTAGFNLPLLVLVQQRSSNYVCFQLSLPI